MFQQFAFQRKSRPINVKKKSDQRRNLDGENSRDRTAKRNVIVISNSPESCPPTAAIETMDKDEELTDEELLNSAFDWTENEEQAPKQSKLKHSDQINPSPTKNIHKLNKKRVYGKTGNVDGKMDGKDTETTLITSSTEISDNLDTIKKKTKKKSKPKRKRVRSFNDSDSDVCSTPKKKHKESEEIEIISSTKHNGSLHSPNKSTDGRVDLLRGVFPNRNDDEILEALKITDNIPQTAVLLANRSWSPLKEISDNLDTIKKKTKKKSKPKRKRVQSFNDSDSDVCSTPKKKHKESEEIEIIGSTKHNGSLHSPNKSTDGRVDLLRGVFPNRNDDEILEALKITDNIPQTAVLLANRSWSPLKDRLQNAKKDTTTLNGEVNPDVIEILDDEGDDHGDDDNNDAVDDSNHDDAAEHHSEAKDGRRSSRKDIILSFLNNCSIDDLLVGFSVKQANKIIKLQPFESLDDLISKLYSMSPGQSDKILQICRSLLKQRTEILRFMEKCEKISNDIQKLLPDNLDGELPNEITQPSILNPNCHLKPYQLTGLHWLKLMHKKEMNCILADEMGLGKTIQALSFIAHLIEQGDDGPYLIVAPASTISNWVRELELWCPTVHYIQYSGSLQERLHLREEIRSQHCQVIITTYQTVISTANDRGLFRKLGMHYVIFDEGHMLKNMKSQRYQKLFDIKAQRRLLLTGTPLQNDLLELMSLLNFVMPHMFGDISEGLKMLFTNKKGENYAKERLYQAKSIMKPFVLRRLKKDVLNQLPHKTEEIVIVDLIDKQRDLYNKVFMECYEKYKNQGGLYSKNKNLMMPLRLTSNHALLLRSNYTDSMLQEMATKYCRDISNHGSNPDLVYEDMTVMSDYELHQLCLGQNNLTSYALGQDMVLDSGKLNYLAEILPDMKKKGDRILLFSQFVLVMDLIEAFLKHHRYKFLRLDGQTKVEERQNLIDRFNNESDIFIFLLSTRAGGLGINLTSANVVILHDIDFNPYNDKQAEDRCHRVGQTRDVHVYKLIARNTIEEVILKRAKIKLAMEKDVVSSKDSKDDEESEDDLATILGQTFG